MGAHKFVTLFVAFYEAGPLKWGHMCPSKTHTHARPYTRTNTAADRAMAGLGMSDVGK